MTVGTVAVVAVWLLFHLSAFEVVPLAAEFAYTLLTILAVGLGMVFAGRCFCVTVPPDAWAVRAWALLMAVYDGCGLISGVITVVVLACRMPVEPVLAVLVVVFSMGRLLLGRTAFHYYLRALGKLVGERPLGGWALASFWHAVATALVSAVALWLVTSLNSIPLAKVWLLAVTLAILPWMWQYLRLLHAVGAPASAYIPPQPDPADDPDREYRERYMQGARDGLVSPENDG